MSVNQCRNRSLTKLKQGFTLIELLVVIAIIAILAAILFPVFARARENARRSSCSSNMKQVALGIIQYNQDYDEKFPMPITTADASGQVDRPWDTGYTQAELGWDHAVQPYIKSTQLFRCSSTGPGNDVNLPPGAKRNADWSGHTNYAINRRITGSFRNFVNGGPPNPSANPRPISLAGLEFSAATILLTETHQHAAVGANLDDGGGWAWTDGHQFLLDGKHPIMNGQSPLKKHLDGANYAFADGHVKWYNASRMQLSVVGQTGGVANSKGNDPTYCPSPSCPPVNGEGT